MRENRFAVIDAAAAMLLLLVGGYLGSYVVLMEPETVEHIVNDGMTETIQSERLPSYRLESVWMGTAFAPVHWLDGQIRPEYWALSEPQIVWQIDPPGGTLFVDDSEEEPTELPPE